MAIFEALSNELLTRVVSTLDKHSLSQMRLVNKRLEQISVERLFRRISLYAHWRKESGCASRNLQGVVQSIHRREQEDDTFDFDVTSNDQSPYECATPGVSTPDQHTDTTDLKWDDKCWREQLGRRLDRDLAIATQGQLCERVRDQASSSNNSVAIEAKRQLLDSTPTQLHHDVDSLKDDSHRDEDEPFSIVSKCRSFTGKHRDSSFNLSKPSSQTSQHGQYSESSSIRGRSDSSVEELEIVEAGEVDDMSSDTGSHRYMEEGSQRDGSEQSELEDEEDGRWETRPILRIRASSSPIPQWAMDGFPGPPDYDARLFRNILQNTTLNRYVRELQIYTCDVYCDLHPVCAMKWFDGDFPRPEFDPIYHECINRLGELPNLRSITIHFDRHANGCRPSFGDVLQDSDFQQQWLKRIFCSVNEGSRATEIAVRHYENTPDLEEAPLFLETISKVESLRLSIKHEEDNRLNLGSVYQCGIIRPFWETFPVRFLQPLQNDLAILILYSDLPLGWFPKLDLRKIHFQKLRSLTLGQHIFHHDHQVDWIISHGSTLKELYLDRCSILYQIGHTIPDWLNEEGYPSSSSGSSNPEHYLDPVEFSSKLQFASFDLRWHQVLSRFTENLHALEDFRLGSSTQWVMNTPSRYAQRGCTIGGLPIMPWEDEKNIENQILKMRYMIWDDMKQMYRPRWISKTGLYNGDEYDDKHWQDEWKTRFAPYPDCTNEDEAALQALLEKIRKI